MLGGHLSEMCFLCSSLQLFSRVSSLSLCCGFSSCLSSLPPSCQLPLWFARVHCRPGLAPLALFSWLAFGESIPIYLLGTAGCRLLYPQAVVRRYGEADRTKKHSSQSCDHLALLLVAISSSLLISWSSRKLNTEEKWWCGLHKVSPMGKDPSYRDSCECRTESGQNHIRYQKHSSVNAQTQW